MPEAIEMRPEGVELEVNDDMTKALEAAVSPEEIKQIIAQEAAKQNIVIPRDNKGRFVPVAEKKETAPADKKDDETFVYSDDFSIGGKDYHFEGDSPADINRQVKAAIAAHEKHADHEGGSIRNGRIHRQVWRCRQVSPEQRHQH